MNIFNILSMGDSKIKEPSITAFIGYVLNPNEDHGLSFFLINRFERLLGFKETTFTSNLDIEIKFEEILKDHERKIRRDTDITIYFRN